MRGAMSETADRAALFLLPPRPWQALSDFFHPHGRRLKLAAAPCKNLYFNINQLYEYQLSGVASG